MSLGFEFHYDSFIFKGKKYKLINNITPMDYFYNLNPGSVPMNDNGHFNTARLRMGSAIYSFVLSKLIYIKPDELKMKLGRSELVSWDFSVPFINKLFEIICPYENDNINKNEKMKNGFDEVVIRKNMKVLLKIIYWEIIML